MAAVSAGIVDDEPLLDLCYEEDSAAQVDLNCVMTDRGQLVEIQGTGEGRPLPLRSSGGLVELCAKGIRDFRPSSRRPSARGGSARHGTGFRDAHAHPVSACPGPSTSPSP